MAKALSLPLLLDFVLAAKPSGRDVLPMGWMDWSIYRCDIDESLIRNVTESMVENGWLAAGYDTVHIDDCWASKDRDSKGRLQADPDRFPSGMKVLTDWVHSKGMKLGIYSGAHTMTCAKFQPGSEYNEEIDAQTFIDWGVDYLKYDACQDDLARLRTSYKKMGDALRGSQVQYACSLGMKGGDDSVAEMIDDGCDLWRIFHDIQAKKGYGDIVRITEHWGDQADIWRNESGPSSQSRGWFDPDQMVAGDSRVSATESVTQFALWTIMSAPLIMGNRLADLSDAGVKEAFQNPELIALARDPLARMGGRVTPRDDEGQEVWARQLADGALAVLLWYKASPDACKWHVTQDINSKDSAHELACVKKAHFEYTKFDCCASPDCEYFTFDATGGVGSDVGGGCLFTDAVSEDSWETTEGKARFALKKRATADDLSADVSVSLATLRDAGLWGDSDAVVRDVLQRKDLGTTKKAITAKGLIAHGVALFKLTPVESHLVV